MRFFKLSQRAIILIIALLIAGCNKTPPPPNIIVFLVDDMGWQDTSVPFYKNRTALNQQYNTPAMERLAAQGMKFTQAYSHSICSPTRVSLITGMNPARHRVTNWTLRKDTKSDYEHESLKIPEWNYNGLQPVHANVNNAVHATTLPEILQDNGYTTIHCGKAHFGAENTPGADPLNLGFEVNIGGHAAGAPGSYHGQNNFSSKWRKGSPIWDVPHLEKYHGQEINLTEALTREVKSSLDTIIDSGKPFFLHMAHYAVHTPLEEDKRFIKKYDHLDAKEAKYASMIESMDKSLGDILDYLEQKEVMDNTIILFTSDNGGLSAVARGGDPHTHNLPLSSGKGSAHEGGIREPMLVSWPGVIEPKTETDEYLIIEDFFPTILAMAGIENFTTEQTIDGKSFLPLIQGTPSKEDRSLFWHVPNNWGPKGPGIGAASSIRKGDWKLIYYHETQDFELFDLATDIGEQNNLAEYHIQIKKELASELSGYLKSVNAQMPSFKANHEMVPWPNDIL